MWKQRWASYDTERNWRILDAVSAVAAELGATPGQVALAWLLTRPQVSSVIFGARTVEQLDDNLAAATLVLGADHVAALDAASAFELGYPYQFIAGIAGRW